MIQTHGKTGEGRGRRLHQTSFTSSWQPQDRFTFSTQDSFYTLHATYCNMTNTHVSPCTHTHIHTHTTQHNTQMYMHTECTNYLVHTYVHVTHLSDSSETLATHTRSASTQLLSDSHIGWSSSLSSLGWPTVTMVYTLMWDVTNIWWSMLATICTSPLLHCYGSPVYMRLLYSWWSNKELFRGSYIYTT